MAGGSGAADALPAHSEGVMEHAKGNCLPLPLPLPHLVAGAVFLGALAALYLAPGSLGSLTGLEGQGEECWPLVQIPDSVHLGA